MLSPELKPCPFCGGAPFDRGFRRWECKKCGAQGPAGTYAEATAGWNTRAQAQPGGFRLVPVDLSEEMVSGGMVAAQMESVDKPFLWSAAVKSAWRAMLASAPPPPAVTSGWWPISDAPRDGTHIILAFVQDHSAEGWYVDDDNEPRPWAFIDIGDNNEVIINRSRDGEYGPSHWQPMPYREPRNRPMPPESPHG